MNVGCEHSVLMGGFPSVITGGGGHWPCLIGGLKCVCSSTCQQYLNFNPHYNDVNDYTTTTKQ